jgi:hypothetical protein
MSGPAHTLGTSADVLPFPAPPLRLARPTDDTVVVFHDGKALRFDSPAAMRRAVMDAELQAQAQAAINAALTLSRDLKAEREANAVRLRALIADQDRLRRHAVRDWSCAAFALGLVFAAVLFGA